MIKFKQDKGIEKKIQVLCREQMKEKLLQDILIDINICKLENWDYKEYLIDLKNIIDNFLLKEK